MYSGHAALPGLSLSCPIDAWD